MRQDRDVNILPCEKQTRSINGLLCATVIVYQQHHENFAESTDNV